jgi:hypothetical protein
VFLVADINFITVTEAFSHSLINTIEILFVISGVVSAGILILSYIHSKQEKNTDKVVAYENDHIEDLEGHIDSHLDNNPNPKTFADNLDEELPSKS